MFLFCVWIGFDFSQWQRQLFFRVYSSVERRDDVEADDYFIDPPKQDCSMSGLMQNFLVLLDMH